MLSYAPHSVSSTAHKKRCIINEASDSISMRQVLVITRPELTQICELSHLWWALHPGDAVNCYLTDQGVVWTLKTKRRATYRFSQKSFSLHSKFALIYRLPCLVLTPPTFRRCFLRNNKAERKNLKWSALSIQTWRHCEWIIFNKMPSQ